MNKQIPRQLRKKLAHSRMEFTELAVQFQYVVGFVQFLSQNGVDVADMERKYREHIDQQAKA